MSRISRILDGLVSTARHRRTGSALGGGQVPRALRTRGTVGHEIEELESRDVPSLLGQQLFPSDYPMNQNIANAPVASNSASVISHIGSTVKVHPDLGYDSSSNGAAQLYGIPVNVVHGNSVSKVNVIVDGYPSQSDQLPVPIPSNPVIEGDYQNGPNLNGRGYNSGQRGDSHLIIWDEDNNIAYEMFGTERPNDTNNTTGKWEATQETVWNMTTNQFRTLGETSVDAAGLSVLAGLLRPDEALPTSQGGQGAIDHALRFTLPSSDINPQYIYPASHEINVASQSSDLLPLGARLRLANTPAIDAKIAQMGPEAQIVATAMQQYGLILADDGSSMYVSGTSASVDANNNISLTWSDSFGGGGLSDILGLEGLNAGDFQVVNLTPVVTGLSASSGSAGTTVTITGQNFSGAAGHLSVYFGSTAATSVTVVSDTQVTAVVPSGSGTVNVTVQSGVNETDSLSSNHNANVNAPIFGYGTSATSSADLFTYSSTQTVSGSNSTAAFAASTDTSGTTDVLTITVKDAAGNGITGLSASAFALSLSGGTSAGTFGSVTETGSTDTYTTTFTGTTAGTASTLTVTVDGVQLTDQPTVQVVPGAVSSSNSTATFATPTDTFGTTDVLTITVKDAAGNAITGLSASAFSLSLSGGTSAGTFGSVTETGSTDTYTATFTGTTAGTASTLTATVGGVQLTAHPTVQVVPGAVSGSNSTAAFAASTDTSGTTDVLTITVKDAAGNAITGLSASAFSLSLSGGTSAGTFGSVTETGSTDTYTATFTGTTAGTATTLTATVGGVQLTAHPTVQVVPGAVSGSNSTATFATPTDTSGTTDVLTITVKDAAGNAITGLSASAFSLSLAGGTSAGTFGSVTETGSTDTYTATFTGTTAGTATTLTATVGGIQLTAHPTVQVVPGAVSGSNSTAAFAASTDTSGTTDVLTITVKDAAGNGITGLSASAFALSLSGGTSAGTFGSVTETGTSDTYTATFTGTTAGTASTLTATVGGVQLNDQPTVQVVSAAVSGSNSTATFATPTDTSGTTDLVTLVVENAAGNAITGLSASAFSLALSGGTSTGTFGPVVETGTSDTYTATFTGTTAGTASTLTATVGGVQLTAQPTVQVVPGAASGSNSTAAFATPTVLTGNTDVVTITVEDAAGNGITGLSASAFALSLSGGASTGTFGSVTETGTSDTYTATFTGSAAGTASTLTATVGGVQLTAHPTVQVVPGAVSGSNSTAAFAASTDTSGTTDVLTITAEDAAGNGITGLSASAFSLALSGGTSTGTFGPVVETGTSDTYTATFTGTTAGTASTLTATVDGVQLTAQPTVQVVPGAASGSNSTAAFATPTDTSGTTDLVTLVVEDAAGNGITGLSASAFALSLSGGASTGTFGSVTETGTSDTYTATFTGTTAGTASTLTATVGGVQLTAQPTVQVVPGAASGSNSTAAFATPMVLTGNTDVVTITVEDAAGNGITGLSASAFALSLSGGASTGTFGSVTETGTSDTYTATFTGTTAGTASTLTATVGGVQLTAQPTVQVVSAVIVSPPVIPPVSPPAQPIALPMVMGALPGTEVVRVLNADGTTRMALDPYAGFLGGVVAAVGDVNGDGVADVVTAAPINGHVKVFNGVTGAEMSSFYAFPGYLGPVSVAVGDLFGDGHADLIVSANLNGHMKVFDGTTGALMMSFFAYAGYNGPVSAAVADVTGAGHAELITAAEGRVGVHVKVMDPNTQALLDSFYATGPGTGTGFSLAAGDFSGTGVAELLVAQGPEVRVIDDQTKGVLADFDAFAADTPTHVTVQAAQYTGSPTAEVVATDLVGTRSYVKVFDGPGLGLDESFYAGQG